MNNEIIQTIDALAERLGVAVANAQPYAEDLCNRIITNTIVSDVLVITLFLISSVSAAIVLPKWWKVDKSYMSEEEEFFRMAITFVWAVAIFVVCLVSMACIAELKDCLIAPEVVIINKLLEVAG